MLGVPVRMLDLAAAGADHEARPHRLAAGDSALAALIGRLAEVDLAKGGPPEELETERQPVVVDPPGPGAIFVLDVDQDLALEEPRLALVLVVAAARLARDGLR